MTGRLGIGVMGAGVIVLLVALAGASGTIPIGAAIQIQCETTAIGHGCTGGAGALNLTPSFETWYDGSTMTINDTSAVYGPATCVGGPIDLTATTWLNITVGSSAMVPYYGALGQHQSIPVATGTSVAIIDTLMVVEACLNATSVYEAVAAGSVIASYVSTTSSTGGSGSAIAGFAYTISGYEITVSDTSTASGGAALTGASFSWGDGTSASNTGPGGTTSHTYTAAGSYTVILLESWTPAPSASVLGTAVGSSATAALLITVPASTSGNTGGNGTAQGVPGFTLPLTLLAIGGGIGLLGGGLLYLGRWLGGGVVTVGFVILVGGAFFLLYAPHP